MPAVLRDLADHDQVVLYFRIWRLGEEGKLHRTQHDRVGRVLDRTLRWSENVAGAQDADLLEAGVIQETGDLLAMIEWIDEK